MKALILISSIFYLLGVKISNHIDLFKRSPKSEKIRTHESAPVTEKNSIDYKDAQSSAIQSEETQLKEQDATKPEVIE